MSNFTWYDAGTTTIGVNAKEVSQRLGELRRKTPAVINIPFVNFFIFLHHPFFFLLYE